MEHIGKLIVRFPGQWLLMDAKTKILVNGVLHSTHSVTKGFTVIIPVTSDRLTLKVVLGGLRSTTYELKGLEEGQDYAMELTYSTTAGKFSKEFRLSKKQPEQQTTPRPSSNEKIQTLAGITNQSPQQRTPPKESIVATDETKWYNNKTKLFLSVLFWPILIYGIYKTALINKTTKQIIGGILAVLIVIGVMKKDDDDKNVPPTMSVTSYELENAYNQNNVAANEMYWGKTINVSGTIFTVLSENGEQSVIMAQGDDMVIQFTFKDRKELLNLREDQRVVITGICRGRTTNPKASPYLIVMDHCRLYNEETNNPQNTNAQQETNQISQSATSSSTLTIGKHFGGGIIAYILQPGDPGYSATVQHGLIAAPTDQSAGVVWFNGHYVTIPTTSVGIGAGRANTNAIISAQGAGTYAASICKNLTLNGYSDWYLPSINELNELYLNRAAIGGFNASATYWCSTEAVGTEAYYWNFDSGVRGAVYENTILCVRAVRNF